jgi:hypothetical protein
LGQEKAYANNKANLPVFPYLVLPHYDIVGELA